MFENFTNLYSLSKTLRFELKPVGRTRINIEKANPKFIHDQEIENAYQVLKPVFDKLHEEFITKSLESAGAKKLDVKRYFELYQKMRAEQDREKKRVIEKDIEKGEVELRKFFGDIYEESGEQFKVDAIDQNAKNILDYKLANAANAKEKKKIEKGIKKLVFLEEKSYKVLTEAGILKYIKARIDAFVAMNLKTRDGKLVGKADLEKALGTAYFKGVFEGFFTYLSGFNENRENYYSVDEKSTAVANRVVGENLPKFCDNVIEFEKKKTEYLGVYKFLEGKGIELKGKSQDGQDIHLEPIMEDIYKIDHFVNCLSQPEIEKYNLQVGNANNLINRYNQQQADKKDKLRIFKTLYKQIGCGDKGEFIQTIKSDDELKEILKDVGVKGDKYFGDFDKGIVGKVDTIGEFFTWMKENAWNEGVFWSDKALNIISGKHFANWFVLKKALKDGGVFHGKKKDDEDIKIPQAVELKKLFEILDRTQSWQDKGALFKESLFEGENHKKKIIEKAMKPSEALLEMILADVKNMAKDFSSLKEVVLKIADFKDQENVQKIKQFLDSLLYVNQMVKYWKVKENKFPVDPALAEALKMILFGEENPTKNYDIVRNYLTRKPQEELRKLKLNFDNSVLAGGWDVNKEPERWCILLKDSDDNKYLAILTDKTKSFFKKENDNPVYQVNKSSWKKMDYKLVPGPNKMLPKVLLPKSDRNKFGATAEILKIYDEGGFKKDSVTKQVNKEKLGIVINFFKEGLKIYPNLENSWQKTFGFNFSDTSKYESIDQFYNEVEKQGYKISWSNINKNLLDEKVESGEIYLFEIRNKDNNLRDGKVKASGKNLHTIYWNAVFGNIENKPKLNGEAEIFYRPAVKDLIKDKDENGKTIGASKKRFEEEKFVFHCPITLNFCLKSSNLNDEINKAMGKTKVCFIGIDRGEKHLAYYSVIDEKGNILEQGTLNIAFDKPIKAEKWFEDKTKPENAENRWIKKIVDCYDYNDLLDARASNRDRARKNWQTIGTIKELKDGYISQVVHRIVDLAVKHNAYIVLENLNTGFKRGRQKIEKSVYQKLELALAKKLNFLVDKKAKDGDVKSVQKALQLTPPVANFSDIEKASQFGIMLYVRANYTSQTDPVTGWRKTIYLNKGSEENIKQQICECFDDFGFDGKDYYFTYTTKYEKTKEKGKQGGKTGFETGKTWTLYSGKNGKDIDRYWNKKSAEENNRFVPEKQKIKEVFDELFKNFDKEKSLRDQILDNGIELTKVDDRPAWETLRWTIELIQKIRNTGLDEKDDDFILSPVRDENGDHFDSRVRGAIVSSGDANGAYNIARKGVMVFGKIQDALKNAKIGKVGKEKIDYDLYIEDKEWDKWLAGIKE